MKNPHIKIESKGNGLADVSGIADCDDAILFCRAAADIMASPMDYTNRQKFLSEMLVSVLRHCVFETEDTGLRMRLMNSADRLEQRVLGMQ